MASPLRPTLATSPIGLALLAACAASPNASRTSSAPPVRRPMPPITMQGVVDGFVGAFAIDRMPAETQAEIAAEPPYDGKGVSGHLYIRFRPESPVTMLRYRTSKPTPRDTRQPFDEAALTHVEVHLLAEFGKHEAQWQRDRLPARRQELAAAGLEPTGVLGLYQDGNGRYGLLASTARPEWGLLFEGDELVAVVRAVGDAPLSAQVQDLAALSKMADGARNAVRSVKLAMANRPTSIPGGAEWHTATSALLERYGAHAFEPVADRFARAAARLQSLPADDLRGRLVVYTELAPLTRDLRAGDGVLPQLVRWHAEHVESWRDALARRLGDEFQRPRVRSVWDDLCGWLSLRSWSLGAQPPSEKARKSAIEHFEFEVALADLREQSPLLETARRLRFAHQRYPLRGRDELTFAQGEAVRLRQRAADLTAGSFEATAAAAFETGIQTYREGWLKHADLLERCAAIAQALAADVGDADATADMLQAVADTAPLRSAHTVPVQRLADAARKAAGERLAAMPANGDTRDDVFLRAVRARMSDPASALATAANARALLAATRALQLPAALEPGIAAAKAFAGRNLELGPAAAEVAGELSLPLARQLAEQAAELGAQGRPGMAAMQLLHAATVADATALEPRSPAAIRADIASMRGDPSLASDERRAWRMLARSMALAALEPALPRVAATDPASELADRYFAAQLGGTSAAARWFGVRLTGLRSARPAADAPTVHLCEVDGAPRWLPIGTGAPIDLSTREIDAAGWGRLRTMRREIDELTADLEAARSARGTSRQDLEAQDAQLSAEAQQLTAALQAGAIDRDDAKEQLRDLERRAAALRRTLQNWNRQTEYANELNEQRNAKVKPHNELLAALFAQQASAWREVVGPATEAYVRDTIASSGLPEDEQAARLWLCGLRDEPGLAGALASEHPATVERLVRDCADPARAAAYLLDVFARRKADGVRFAGWPAEQHVAALAPALDAFAAQYGVDDLVSRLVGAGAPLAGLREAVGAALTTERRAALERLLSGSK